MKKKEITRTRLVRAVPIVDISSLQRMEAPLVQKHRSEPEAFRKSNICGNITMASGYPYPSQQQTTVIVQAPVFASDPINTTCPNCGQVVNTHVEYENNTKTHIWGACLCFWTGLMCCWIPYCTKTCRTAVHSCPKCQYALGTYEP